MNPIDIPPQAFKISDFLGWQREGSLTLSPRFQRRPVWRPGAKSYLIDTIVRGLPVPAIMVREKLDLKLRRTTREVVDGQQRLRTIFSYIEPKVLSNFDPTRDAFTVDRLHNKELAGKQFKDIDESMQVRLLSYTFGTHVLPSSVEDRDILEMFARINSTGVKLNAQELRNAQYFGAFKDTVYQLALEQLERWRDWKVFNDTQIARMNEVELVSDLALSIVKGLSGKDQKAIGELYGEYEATFPQRTVFTRRFRRIMDAIETLLGGAVRDTVYSGQVHFWTLFAHLYDRMYGLGNPLAKGEGQALPTNLDDKLWKLSDAFSKGKVPADVLDAVVRAPVDIGRRRTRLDYYKSKLGS